MIRIANWPAVWQWITLVGAGLSLGAGFQAMHLPAGLMLGPLLTGAVMSLRGAGVRVPQVAHRLSQGIAGCLIALHLDASVLVSMVAIWPIVLLFVVLTFVVAVAVGLVAGRWSGIGREVSIWGFLPGMAGTVIAIAHERGLDSRMVAFIQILRLMVVIAAMVTAAMMLTGAASPHGRPGIAPDLASTLTVFAVALSGPMVGRWLPMIPAGSSLVPLVLAAGLSIFGVNVAMPGWLVALGFLGLGAQIGLRFTPDLLRTGVRALPSLLAASLLLIVLCAISGGMLSLITGVDLMSALLATVPGSIDSITIIAITSNSDMAFVMTLQTVRLFAVAMLGPWVATMAIRLSELRDTRRA